MRIPALDRWPHVWRALLLTIAGLCALAGLVVEHGLYPRPAHAALAEILSLLALAFFAWELVLAWRQRRSVRDFLRQRWPAVALSALVVLQLVLVAVFGEQLLTGRALAWLRPTSLMQLFLAVVQVYVLGLLLVNLPRLHTRFAQLRIRPGLAFLLVFAVAIVAGSGLLCLPRATPPEAPITYLDALFTSTSAVCVTGLAVRDTGTEFTRFGQVVILVLIQLGGLGIMSVAGAMALLFGRGIGIRETSLMQEVFQLPALAEVGGTLRFIVLWTLSTEALGAALLYGGLQSLIPDPGERAFCAIFHAVSAFCNAGFSTYADSLIGWSSRPFLLLVVAALIVIGGLGFTVMLDLILALRAVGQGRPRSQRPRLRLQTRIVVAWSAWLVGGGAALLLLLEGRGGLAGGPWTERVTHAIFQSATCRTAGFNSVDLAGVGSAALFLMIVLMFIGGGSGSAAGGVKVTTLATVAAEIRSIAAGRRQVRLRDRELDDVDCQRATVVVTTSALVAAAGTFVLLLTEGADLLAVAFEVISALGTVGLSLGLTPHLTAAGKLVVILLMFVGRLGVLTLAYGLVRPARDAAVRLPGARLMIG